MITEQNPDDAFAHLHQQAETIIAADPPDLSDYSPEQIERLIYNLKVYQVELELQNEELRRIQFEREVAQESLRTSEALHRIIINSISDAVFITDDIGQFTYICPNVDKIFGYSVADVSRINYISGLLGRNIYNPTILQAKGELKNIEVIVRDKAGLYHVLLVNVKRVTIQGGTILYTCRDITEHKQSQIEREQLLAAVTSQRRQLKTLTGQLAEAQESERKALARELHDQIGQKLTSLNLNLNALRVRCQNQAQSQGIIPIIDQALQLVEETTERIHNVMVNLRPPVLDDYGLVAALQWYATELAPQVSFTIQVQGQEPAPRLPNPTENALFRITQEALTNAIKHSRANHVTLSLAESNRRVRLTIADDGRGFTPSHKLHPDNRTGWGLLTMMERAEAVGGYCFIKSEPGQGTQVIVEVFR